jgi:acyl-CoA synthetase (AMP-forming)/AMP-acid ligase II
MQATEGICEEDTLLCVLPLFHIYGLVVILNLGLFAGATIVLQRRFELASTLKAIEDYGVTFAHLVPPVMLAIASDPTVPEYDFSRLRAVMSAAAPLSGELAELCSKRLGCVVKQGYGMTETSPAATMERPIAELIKPGSVGQPVPNTELMIVDLENSTPLGPRQTGEVLIRGPQVMHGYLNKPEATASTITEDGWLRSGDIGYVDEDGYLFIVDRAKELIKYKGFQVAPAELESLLLAHPAVADVAVVPIPDVEAGELPKAFVVSRFPVSEIELIDYVAERVTPYKRVRAVEFIDQIPKSPSGKILRRVLRARERERLGVE